MSGRRRAGFRIAVLAALLVAATAWAYRPVGRHQFIRFDDGSYVATNPMVAYGFSREGVAWALRSFHAGNWHPLTWFSHMADVELFGLNPGRHHVMSLALHCLSALLLGLVLWRMTGALWSSLSVAAVFALHPLHVESVAWVAERKDVLSALFGTLTLAAYLRYSRRPVLSRYLPVVAGLGVGLMAKPMLVTLPVLLLLLDVWPLGRWRLRPGQEGEGWRDRRNRQLLLEKAPLAALAICSSIVTLAAQSRGGAVVTLAEVPPESRVANAVLSYATYLRKAFWPSGLAIYYPFDPAVSLAPALVAAALLGGLTFAALSRTRTAPYLSVGWLWFLGTLIPVIGLVRVGGQAMADRYTYVPLTGLFIGVVWWARDLGRRRGLLVPVAAAVTLTLLLLASLTRLQVGFWEDNLSVFARAVAVTHGNALAHNNLAATFRDAGRTEEAIAEYRKAVQAEPANAEAHNNLGLLLAGRGLMEEAVAEYRRALAASPGDAGTHSNLSIALMKLGREAEAQPHYREAVRLKPEYRAESHYRYGLRLAAAGDARGALDRYAEAVRLAPDFLPARLALGKAYVGLGSKELAREQQRALGRLDPRLAAELAAVIEARP